MHSKLLISTSTILLVFLIHVEFSNGISNALLQDRSHNSDKETYKSSRTIITKKRRHKNKSSSSKNPYYSFATTKKRLPITSKSYFDKGEGDGKTTSFSWEKRLQNRRGDHIETFDKSAKNSRKKQPGFDTSFSRSSYVSPFQTYRITNYKNTTTINYGPVQHVKKYTSSVKSSDSSSNVIEHYDSKKHRKISKSEKSRKDENDVHPLVSLGFGSGPGSSERRNPCYRSSCYPATGNLLIGRKNKLSTSSTCGLDGKVKFCIVSHLKHRKKCFWCDSQAQFIGNPRYSHRIQNIITRLDPRTQRRSWWQSENGKEDVSIRLDLEAEFHFTHLIVTFRTFRPAAMLIERSYDFGKTWKVYQYFAYNCAEAFPGIPQGPPRRITDVVCVSRYSDVDPSTEGEVIFRVLPPNLPIRDPYSDEVQNLLKITNLRVNFTKLHTLGDQLLDTRPEIKEKYYYAIYDMVVRGSCSCYGHASRCLPLEGVNDRPDMVHGRCECTHNTEGLNCERCQDFYNDLPWRPAIGKETNECKRCNCNNHATRCHFDPNVYNITGRISGGVCDDCAHNTEGRNCEECKPFFYQEPSLSLQHPDVCQPCNCDLRGSENDGICDSKTDSEKGLVAGRCRCKKNVGGLKCDRCKAGFWNYSSSNPVGCDECTCDLLGTINNAGCNEYTGECRCKRNVIGRNCDQCKVQHYGLSDHPDGCTPCDCDRGGSVDNNCDTITGQCKCRPHVAGRKCDKPEEGHFVPKLNYLTYEAELSKGTELYCEEESLYQYRQVIGGNCQVVMREPYRDGAEATWTGIGFMRVFDQSSLEFEIDNIETSMEYDVVIKYEPQFRGNWEDVMLKIKRPGPVDPNGPCRNTVPYDDIRTFTLSDSQRSQTLFPSVCLESGKRYKVILEFRRTNRPVKEKSASILIDSISLLPRAEQLPIYEGSQENQILRQQYLNYHCSDPFYEASGEATLPETCLDDHLDSIGLYIFGQAYACRCDVTGSRSTLCEPYGGQCNCKPYVEGRRCDRCAPGTFGFGPEGCEPCECSGNGALDNFCDQQTGKCKCRPNTYGRQCNECQPGYWNFPNCQRCECHGHADTCDSFTGACHSCRDNTTGPNCVVCLEGFYGDPRLDVGIPCRQCPCPGTPNSGHSFADRCRLEPQTKDVICECDIGYAGARCDVCADNYFGNPEQPGGLCSSCDCNNNIDISRPGNCDLRSGECLQCLFNTDGYNCERCRDGFYGDALNQKCRECVCNMLGTNETIGQCDHITGQCPCYSNVRGLQCDQCDVNHWKLASGEGCFHCNCDPIGSYSDQCNEYTGQCQCREGFGGRQCDQCHQNFFGDPRQECKPCNCNREGSATQQCDHETGQCICMEGIGGFKCDKCARGFHGRAPYCQPCHECFENWDKTLNDLKDRTEALIDSASLVRQKGATGAYSYEFENMDEKIDEVQNILRTANLTSHDLDELEKTIAELNSVLQTKETDIQNLETSVDNTTQRISLASNTLADLRLQAGELRNNAGDLKNKATKLQEANVEGALNLTRAASQRSRDAQVKIEYTEIIVGESDRYRKQTKNILIYKGDRFNRTITMNDDDMDELSTDLIEMERTIPDLNEQICDRRGDPCDSFCGGAGCGKCGGLSCNEGLVNIAKLAVKFAEDTETLLRSKEAAADELLRAISHAKQKSDDAYDIALSVLEETLRAQNMTLTKKNAISTLLKEITDYFNKDSADPDEIKAIAQEILSLDIKLQPEQITELAEKITITIHSLTDINSIIQATKSDLALANRLKARADNAKKQAKDSLEVAKRVVEALNESATAQKVAEEAISKSTADISSTELYLIEITSETNSAHAQANASQNNLMALMRRADNVQQEFKINEQLLDDTDTAVKQAFLTAQRSENEAKQLGDKYLKIERQLEEKSLAAENSRSRAEKLKQLANKLSSEARTQLDELKKLKEEFDLNESKIESYEDILRSLEIRMEEYHKYISHKAIVYTTCTANKFEFESKANTFQFEIHDS